MFFSFTAVETFIIIIAAFSVIYWITPKKHSWLPFVLITVALAWLAYNLVPDTTDDISRYFWVWKQAHEGGWDAMKYFIDEDQFDFKTFRMSAYYIYALSKLNSEHWIPCITMGIVYGSGFYCIYKMSTRFEVNKWHTYLGSMFFLSTYWFYDTCSGLRNGLAFAIIFVSSYQLMVERKYKILCYAGFFVGALMHSAGIIPIVLVLLAEITLNTSGKFLNFALVFGIVGGAAGIRWLSTISDNSFIQGIAGKVDRFEAGGSLETGTMFRVNMTVLFVVLMLILYYSFYILNSDYTNELKRFYKCYSIITYFCIGALFSGLIFVRFARWILPLIGALMFMIGKRTEEEYIEKNTLRYCEYYSDLNVRVRVRTRSYVVFLYIAYMAVHMWYMCNGSSLIWAHFAWEWNSL